MGTLQLLFIQFYFFLPVLASACPFSMYAFSIAAFLSLSIDLSKWCYTFISLIWCTNVHYISIHDSCQPMYVWLLLVYDLRSLLLLLCAFCKMFVIIKIARWESEIERAKVIDMDWDGVVLRHAIIFHRCVVVRRCRFIFIDHNHICRSQFFSLLFCTVKKIQLRTELYQLNCDWITYLARQKLKWEKKGEKIGFYWRLLPWKCLC